MAVQVKSLDEAQLHIESLTVRKDELERRLRLVEKKLDTRDAAWPRRLWWWIDGWPRWTIVATKRAWRPWHRR